MTEGKGGHFDGFKLMNVFFLIGKLMNVNLFILVFFFFGKMKPAAFIFIFLVSEDTVTSFNHRYPTGAVDAFSHKSHTCYQILVRNGYLSA